MKLDVLVLDHELPWSDREGVLACLREDGLSLPVILTTWAFGVAGQAQRNGGREGKVWRKEG